MDFVEGLRIAPGLNEKLRLQHAQRKVVRLDGDDFPDPLDPHIRGRPQLIDERAHPRGVGMALCEIIEQRDRTVAIAPPRPGVRERDGRIFGRRLVIDVAQCIDRCLLRSHP